MTDQGVQHSARIPLRFQPIDYDPFEAPVMGEAVYPVAAHNEAKHIEMSDWNKTG